MKISIATVSASLFGMAIASAYLISHYIWYDIEGYSFFCAKMSLKDFEKRLFEDKSSHSIFFQKLFGNRYKNKPICFEIIQIVLRF